jgi:hypothetical protein
MTMTIHRSLPPLVVLTFTPVWTTIAKTRTPHHRQMGRITLNGYLYLPHIRLVNLVLDSSRMVIEVSTVKTGGQDNDCRLRG